MIVHKQYLQIVTRIVFHCSSSAMVYVVDQLNSSNSCGFPISGPIFPISKISVFRSDFLWPPPPPHTHTHPPRFLISRPIDIDSCPGFVQFSGAEFRKSIKKILKKKFFFDNEHERKLKIRKSEIRSKIMVDM